MQDLKQAVTYTGCIGKDEFGNILESKAKEEGLKTLFMYNSEHSTGTCAVVVTGDNRWASFIKNTIFFLNIVASKVIFLTSNQVPRRKSSCSRPL